jgi:hypothetical protein
MSNYKLNYQYVRPQTWQIHFDMPYDRETVVNSLQSQPWSVTENSPDSWQGLRQRLSPPFTDPVMRDIHQYLCSTEHRRNIINYFYDTVPFFQSRWGMDRDTMYERTFAHGDFIRDLPGFHQDIHTDYRLLVATGMIYLTDRDDPGFSTSFYDNTQGDNPSRITTNFCDGWWHVNDGACWHGGHNATNEDRYSIMIALTLSWPSK